MLAQHGTNPGFFALWTGAMLQVSLPALRAKNFRSAWSEDILDVFSLLQCLFEAWPRPSQECHSLFQLTCGYANGYGIKLAYCSSQDGAFCRERRLDGAVCKNAPSPEHHSLEGSRPYAPEVQLHGVCKEDVMSGWP